MKEIHNFRVLERRQLGSRYFSLELGHGGKMQPVKPGQFVEVLVEGKKYRGQLVSVDEDTFCVDVEEKVAIEGKKRKETQIITHTWRYDEPKYVKYDLRF
jgi:NAD(P)H-flavin reductase